ncbi:Rrf2 family transcriptional regulator [Acutalibacter muris]|uniref:Transcriptional regulator n=1 Tax=Acutalibacter muris TaxID=1796620 RepID=A0A1Z2XSC0_9FIRM|nr:Rrf2 family transcriptional regulator [Acutalibacter muris]ANU55502.1 transcriptional regulator [Hungateiclostridiaceae bacterium KB18]ASB41261.1 transcriptional regulator [Acutalibacter muris]QQR30533.1 Rrf2 family transcriptional regulator [Acutalibacter muris]
MHISTKCSIAIHCLIFINEYGETQKVTSNLLSLSTGSNPVTIRNIISGLKKEGILSVKLGTGGATLSCPLEDITLYRICNALEPDFLNKLIGIHAAPSPLCPIGKNIHSVLDASYDGIRDALQVSLQSVSMKEIVDNYHKLT